MGAEQAIWSGRLVLTRNRPFGRCSGERGAAGLG
jgi:hypothetical protein